MTVTDEQELINTKIGEQSFNQECLKDQHSQQFGKQLFQHSLQIQTVKANQNQVIALINFMQKNMNFLVEQLRKSGNENIKLIPMEKSNNIDKMMQQLLQEFMGNDGGGQDNKKDQDNMYYPLSMQKLDSRFSQERLGQSARGEESLSTLRTRQKKCSTLMSTGIESQR